MKLRVFALSICNTHTPKPTAPKAQNSHKKELSNITHPKYQATHVFSWCYFAQHAPTTNITKTMNTTIFHVVRLKIHAPTQTTASMSFQHRIRKMKRQCPQDVISQNAHKKTKISTTKHRTSQQREKQPCHVMLLFLKTACTENTNTHNEWHYSEYQWTSTLFVAPMPRACVEQFTWDRALPCAASLFLSAGAMSKRLVAFREERASKGKDRAWKNALTSQLGCRGTTLAGVLWSRWSSTALSGPCWRGSWARGTPSERRKRASTPSHWTCCREQATTRRSQCRRVRMTGEGLLCEGHHPKNCRRASPCDAFRPCPLSRPWRMIRRFVVPSCSLSLCLWGSHGHGSQAAALVSFVCHCDSC